MCREWSRSRDFEQTLHIYLSNKLIAEMAGKTKVKIGLSKLNAARACERSWIGAENGEEWAED